MCKNKIFLWLKKEAVLITAFLCALVSAFFVPPTLAYLSYIDIRTLCLLFSMMLVIASLNECGLFSLLAQKLLQGKKQMRALSCLLVLLPFFFSMFITNDVALITFVPFSIFILTEIHKEKYYIRTLVLQTIAANLGSMATPFGNPQNLFLFTKYGLSLSFFLTTIGPFVLASLFLLLLCILFIPNETVQIHFAQENRISKKTDFAFSLLLFGCCIISVLRILPYWLTFILILLFVLIRCPKQIKAVDYSLLFTFVFLFIFSGNMAHIPAINQLLLQCMQHSSLQTAIYSSQMISNVPAAILLSNFTTNASPLVIGTNIGGLGTLIASLASLISYRFYTAIPSASPRRYLLIFTLYNLGFLFLLFLMAIIRI